MAKVQRKGQAPKYIPNCVNYKGYLAQQVKVGVGESHTVGGMFNGEGDVWEEWDRYEKRLKPFFDADKLSAGQRAELSKKLEDKEFNQIQKVIEAGYEFALMKWGEHEKYSVQDQNEIENAKKLEKEKAFENKELTINFIPGFFGLQISERLPKSVWAIVQPFGTYHQGNEDDLEWLDDLGHIGIHPNEVRGWYYEDKAIGALIAEGFSVSYREEKITANVSEEIRRIDGEIKKEQDEFYAEVKAVRAGWEKFSLRLSEMRQNAEYISEMEAEEISKTERITLPGWEGADIYGGGKWFHRKGEDLFLIYNNGHDGDDWSRNNYGTGGAGAIALKSPKNAGILNEMREYLDGIGKMSIYLK